MIKVDKAGNSGLGQIDVRFPDGAVDQRHLSRRRIRARRVTLKRAIPAAALIVFVIGVAIWLWLQIAPLNAIVRGGEGPPTLVLLHGYGGTAENWLQFVGTFRPPATRV